MTATKNQSEAATLPPLVGEAWIKSLEFTTEL